MALHDKYSDIIKELFDTYTIANPSGSRHSATQRKAVGLAEFLRWAIENDERLQRLGEIGVAAVATATGHSRSTVAEAVADLVQLGMLEPRPKAPYRIVAHQPRFSDTLTFASQIISVSSSLTGQQVEVFDQLLPLHELAEAPAIRRFIGEQLQRTPDAEAAVSAVGGDSLWARIGRGDDGPAESTHDIRLFSRLRLQPPGGRGARSPARPFLFELSFICTETQHGQALTQQIDHLRSMEVTSLSVFKLLGRAAGITGYRPGRNRLGVSAIDAPGALFERIIEVAGRPLALDGFAPPQPLLKWNYGTFLPTSDEPLLILSVSYVDTELLKVAARNMDVSL